MSSTLSITGGTITDDGALNRIQFRGGGIKNYWFDVTTPSPTVSWRSLPGATSYVLDQDRYVLRVTGASQVSDLYWEWTVPPTSDPSTSVTRSSSNTSVVIPDPTDPFKWTYVGNGTTNITMQSTGRTLTVSVTMTTQAGTNSDTFLNYQVGSIRREWNDYVTALVNGKSPSSDMSLFSSGSWNSSAWFNSKTSGNLFQNWNSLYATGGLQRTYNYATAPDGTMTATRLRNTPSVNSYGFPGFTTATTVIGVAGRAYKVSYYVKANDPLYSWLKVENNGTNRTWTFDAVAKAFSGLGAGVVEHGYTDEGDGWLRVWVTLAVGPSDSNLSVSTALFIGGYGSTANQNDLFIWGFQAYDCGAYNNYAAGAPLPLLKTSGTAISTLAPVDLSCTPYSTSGNWGCAAISKRHAIFANHAHSGVGSTVVFLDKNGASVSRTITGGYSATGYSPYYPDYWIGLLDSDLPDTVAIAKLLPDNWTSYIPSLSSYPLPTVELNQFKKASLGDWFGLSGGMSGGATFRKSTDPTYAPWWVDKIGGDSSSPCLMYAGGSPLLLTNWTFDGVGYCSGTDHHYKKADISNLCAQLMGASAQSNDFSTAWTYSQGVRNNSTSNGPGGTANASQITCSQGSLASNNVWDFYHTFTGLTVGATYQFSAWVKLGTATNFLITSNNGLSGNSANGSTTEWNTANGGLNTSYFVRVYGSITIDSSARCNIHLGRYDYTGSNGRAVQTAGTIFLWGWQFGLASAFSRNPSSMDLSAYNAY